jgi:hypothetical protein
LLLLQWINDCYYYSGQQNNSELELSHSKKARENGRGMGDQNSKESVWAFYYWKHIFHFNFDAVGGILIHWFLHLIMVCFVNRTNFFSLAMQAHALTRTSYFYRLNVIISYPIVYKEGLGYLSACAIALRSSPPTHVCICNGHPSSDLFCVHCFIENFLILLPW